MEQRIWISILLDFYSELLTEKQKKIMNLYYNDDLSLAEISEHTNTSRQAIYDIIKRCNKILQQYELKLKLVKKNNERKRKKETILKNLNLLEQSLYDRENFELLNKVKKDIEENI